MFASWRRRGCVLVVLGVALAVASAASLVHWVPGGRAASGYLSAGRTYSYDLAAKDALAQWSPAARATPADLTGSARSKSSVETLASSAASVVATEEAAGLSEAFHYTGSQNVASIEANGLRAGSYATPNGELSPLQAQIDLALPPNRGLPEATLRIDVAGLREAGYEIPEVTQVGRSYNMPGGGYEMQFPYPIPPEFIKVVP